VLMVNTDKENADGSPEQVKAVLQNLASDGIDIHRAVAIKVLSSIDGAGSVPVLIKALLDEDEDVRADASEALARIGDKRAAKPLYENLQGDPAGQVKLNAIDGLAIMGYREAIPLLRRLLKGRDEDVVWDEDEFYASEWDDWTDVQLHALKALGALGAVEAVPDILDVLDELEAQDLMETGFKVLASLGKDGIEALGGFLDRSDPRSRRLAAVVLGGLSSPHAGAAIDKALNHEDADVRYACGRAMVRRDPKEERLKILLADPNPAIRAAIAQECLQYHGPLAPVLLKDPGAAVRRSVYLVLAGTPDLVDAKAALEAIDADRKEGDEKTASAAVRAAMAIAPDEYRALLVEEMGDSNQPLEVRLAILQALELDADEPILDVLARNLEVDERQLRLKSMTALARIAAREEWPNRAGDVLLSALRGELIPPPEGAGTQDQDVVEAAFEDVPGIESEAEAESESGIEAEAEDQPGAEESGVEAAGAGEAEVPQSTLAAILSDDPVIADVLKKKTDTVGLSPKDMEFLQLATDRRKKNKRRRLSPDPVVAPYQDVRRFSARLLGDVRNEEVMLALGAALSDPDKEVVRIAADSLTHFDGKAVGRADEVAGNIIEALAKTDPETRIFLIRALGKIGGEEVVDNLMTLTRDLDSYLVAEAVNALDALGVRDPDLAVLLDDNAPRVRLAVAKMLAGLGDDADVEKLAEFAVAHDGFHRREAGRLLRQVNREKANSCLLAILADESRKVEWQAAIEALEEINAQEKNVPVA